MKEGFVVINDNIFSTLLAVSSEEQARGLMYQEWPPPAMSFLYTRGQINKFWMKSTPSPLDIVFCYKGKVSEICYGEPYSTKIIGSDYYSDLIVELPYGTVKSANIKVGDSVELISSFLEK